jgi:hypothetical protein
LGDDGAEGQRDTAGKRDDEDELASQPQCRDDACQQRL